MSGYFVLRLLWSLLIFPPEDRHGLSRKDRFAISYFSTSLIVLRSRSITGSTTGRSGTTHWFDAGDLLIFLYLTTTTRQLACEQQTHFFGGREATTGNASAVRRLPGNLKSWNPFFSISVKIRPEIMFNDVLNTKEAFLEYKNVIFSKSKKSNFIKGVNRWFW